MHTYYIKLKVHIGTLDTKYHGSAEVLDFIIKVKADCMIDAINYAESFLDEHLHLDMDRISIKSAKTNFSEWKE